MPGVFGGCVSFVAADVVVGAGAFYNYSVFFPVGLAEQPVTTAVSGRSPGGGVNINPCVNRGLERAGSGSDHNPITADAEGVVGRYGFRRQYSVELPFRPSTQC